MKKIYIILTMTLFSCVAQVAVGQWITKSNFYEINLDTTILDNVQRVSNTLKDYNKLPMLDSVVYDYDRYGYTDKTIYLLDYNKEGKLIKIEDSDGNSNTLNYENSKLTSIYQNNKNNQNTPILKLKNTYNDKGLFEKREVFYIYNNTLEISKAYDYFENGNISKMTILYNDGRKDETEYMYDENSKTITSSSNSYSGEINGGTVSITTYTTEEKDSIDTTITIEKIKSYGKRKNFLDSVNFEYFQDSSFTTNYYDKNNLEIYHNLKAYNIPSKGDSLYVENTNFIDTVDMFVSIQYKTKQAYFYLNSPADIYEYSSFFKKIWLNEDNKIIKDSTRGLVTIYNDLGNVVEEYVLVNKKAYTTFKYYYRTEGKVLAVKLENKNQRLVIDFNYKLDTTATIADLISFSSNTTLSEINKINISNIYVSKTNNKQLIIDFDRELKIGDSFSLEAPQDLPLSDGRFVALSIKNDQIGTEILEDSASERTTISQNKNEVCIYNAGGIETVELLFTTGVTLANTIAAGANEVKIMLGNYEQGMYIIQVKETSGKLSTFKIVK